jgi:signal transduction histidine kinase
VASEWREIGGLGRLAVVGIVASALLAVGLGFSITNAARHHLLDSRAEIIAIIVDDLILELERDPMMSSGGPFDIHVRELLLGGETVQVNVWLPDGTIGYSDDRAQVGERFELSGPAKAAFGGRNASQVSDLSDPAHAEHVDLGSLIEFYLPLARDAEGAVVSVLEVEQRTDRLEAALGRIAQNVWISIGFGLSALGVFLGILALARARDLNRRRRRAEELLGALLTAQEEERQRIVGALHDDVGQRLYRLLYGIEGTRDRMAESDPLRSQLEMLTEITREIDTTLRAELNILHRGIMRELGLAAAVQRLVDTVRSETDLDIVTVIDLADEPAEVPARVLARAAGEALTNVRRHAAASRVEVRLRQQGATTALTVIDDGGGLTAEPGLGLTTTRDRVEAIDGRFTVSARPGGGTVFEVVVPTEVAQ